MFCQKRKVPDVVLAFLDHLKLKISFVDHHDGRHRASLLFKTSGSLTLFPILHN